MVEKTRFPEICASFPDMTFVCELDQKLQAPGSLRSACPFTKSSVTNRAYWQCAAFAHDSLLCSSARCAGAQGAFLSVYQSGWADINGGRLLRRHVRQYHSRSMRNVITGRDSAQGRFIRTIKPSTRLFKVAPACHSRGRQLQKTPSGPRCAREHRPRCLLYMFTPGYTCLPLTFIMATLMSVRLRRRPMLQFWD